MQNTENNNMNARGDFIPPNQSRFLMRFSSFFIRDSSSGAEAADEAAVEGDCIEVVEAGAVVL